MINKDQVVGKIKDLAGEAQAGIGKAINSPEQVAKGQALEAEGELQKAKGDLRQAAKDTLDEVKKSI
ncbi:CsbD family protein [Comamonas sp. J-3]|uniref:CsbD family protein n=1 Tax=Comamonas trifloxystrobinivorans TaxID=3350256 RepID=UPI00372B78C0